MTDKGLAFDEDFLRNQYNALPPLIRKKARTILLPVCAENGVVYGMDNISGDVVPFSFSRASQATMFDANLDMTLVAIDTPRIDFGNYNNIPKILIERESTNLLLDSDLHLNLNHQTVGGSIINYNWNETLLTNKAVELPTGTTGTHYFYNKYENVLNQRFVSSVFVAKDNNSEIPLLRNNNYGATGTDGGFSSINMTTVNSNKDFSEYIKLKNNIIRSYVSREGNRNHMSEINGIAKATSVIKGTLYLAGFQLEKGESLTSYIPTSNAVATRAADKLSIDLTKNNSVYIYSTKQKKVMDKTAGTWQIADDLDNEGIYSLAIFESVLTDSEKQSLTD